MQEVSRANFSYSIKIQSRLKQSVILVIKTDPNSLQIVKANLSAGASGGGLGGERIRRTEVQSTVPVAANGSHEWTPASKVYVSAFLKTGDHFAVLFLNCQADRGCRYLIQSEDFVGHVKSIDTMEEWKEVDNAAITGIIQGLLQQNIRMQFTAAGGASGGRSIATKPTRKLIVQGANFEGEVNASNLPEGNGTLKWPDGTVYKGEFRAGKIHGKGRMVYRDGNTYEGDFAEGIRQGNGHYKCPEFSYQGDWEKNVISGHGVKTSSVGIYTGAFKENKFHGLGVFIDEAQGGRVFDGVWNMDKWVGPRATTDSYDGFVDSAGQKQGYGVFKTTGGTYEGEFKDNKFNGNGKYTASNFKYEGEWKDDQFHGFAVYTTSAGVYNGMFKNGKKHGKGTFVDKLQGNQVFEGFWANDDWVGTEEQKEPEYISVW